MRTFNEYMAMSAYGAELVASPVRTNVPAPEQRSASLKNQARLIAILGTPAVLIGAATWKFKLGWPGYAAAVLTPVAMVYYGLSHMGRN